MATDMQPLFSGFPSRPAPALQDARDRQPAFQGAEPSRHFETVLGRAEARQSQAVHDAPPVRNGDRTATHARPLAHSTPESSTEPSDRSTVSEDNPQTLARSERSREKMPQSTDESEPQDRAQESKKNSHEQDTLPQDIMLAAMIVPAAQTAPVEEQPTQAETGADHSENAGQAIATIPMESGAKGTAPSTSLGAPSPAGDVAADGLPARETAPRAATGREAAPAEEPAGKDTVQREVKDIPLVAGQAPVSEGRATGPLEVAAGFRMEPDRLNPALAAMTVSKQDPKHAEQAPLENVDRSAVLDALAQGTSLGESQAGSGAGRFMEQDGQSLPDSSGGADRSLPNQTPSIDQGSRPVFLDRMTSLAQAAPAGSDSSSGRSESGQTAAVLRASESERVNDLRGAAPVSHSVTLDLDPLDMGPLRVRVMMSDQTVHAHIRTEHGELGQGLLQQGQSLESSLRTTGLEMGMLRVTVDQQQGRGDNAWMFQQQQPQGRPPSSNMSQSATREDERGARGDHGAGSNERLSFFA